jgi:hypothetical protein
LKNKLLKEIVSSFDRGELESLQKTLIPFLRENRTKLIQFIENFEKLNGKQPLETLIKLFILTYNMPFNMKSYMNHQRMAIQRDLGNKVKMNSARQTLVADWIRKKAESYRSHTILSQIVCFDRLKSEIVPAIQDELKLRQSLKPGPQSGLTDAG